MGSTSSKESSNDTPNALPDELHRLVDRLSRRHPFSL